MNSSLIETSYPMCIQKLKKVISCCWLCACTIITQCTFCIVCVAILEDSVLIEIRSPFDYMYFQCNYCACPGNSEIKFATSTAVDKHNDKFLLYSVVYLSQSTLRCSRVAWQVLTTTIYNPQRSKHIVFLQTKYIITPPRNASNHFEQLHDVFSR